ncbi:MAG: STAS domain-containing protein [Rhodoferax sp.]|nr:STAS domain-containing protein [Rhodoferax sp.]
MLTLPTILTHSQAKDCLQKLTHAVQHEAEKQVVVDAAPLNNFDSSALAVLLALRRECARAGKLFTVRGLPDHLRALAALYGIEALLTPA